METQKEKEPKYCKWFNYKKNCEKVCDEKNDFCSKHKYLKNNFEFLIDYNDSCSNSRYIKIIPRSRQFLQSIIGDDLTAEIYYNGGYTENVTLHEDYIEIESDKTRYYYNPDKGQKSSKNIKIRTEVVCQKDPVVLIKNQGIVYCKNCYEKYGKKTGYNYPHINLLKELKEESKEEIKEEIKEE